MATVLDILAWAALLSGAFFVLVGGIGLVRMPDFFTRGHAAGVTDTLGAGLIIVGLMLESGFTLNLARLAFILLFLLFTSPTAGHALAHAALTAGLKPWTRKTSGETADEDGTSDNARKGA